MIKFLKKLITEVKKTKDNKKKKTLRIHINSSQMP
jgi:hypothetical protein